MKRQDSSSAETKESPRPVVNPLVVLREDFDDVAVLFNPDTGDAVGINAVGLAIFKLLDGNHDVHALVAEVQRSFADVPAKVNEEIAAFVTQLADGGFVGYEAGRSVP